MPPLPSLPLLAVIAALALAGCATRVGPLPVAKPAKARDLPVVVEHADGTGGTVQLRLRDLVPGGSMSSGFGWRGHSLGGSMSTRHEGIDIVAPKGTPVRAAASGTVVDAGWRGAYGRFVLLRHSGRIDTAYAHLGRFASDLKPGRRVKQGDVIGYVGSTGRSNGPHLHYEVRRNSKPINPLESAPARSRPAKRASSATAQTAK